VDSDLRWIDLYLRRGDTTEALTLISALKAKTDRAPSADLSALIAAREADAWLQMNDPHRAEDLMHDAERALDSSTIDPGDHVRSLVACTKAAVRMTNGDLDGARRELTVAYAAARAARDLPILSVVAVHSAALAAAGDLPAEAAVLLGAAARLRGAHDRTDPRIRRLGSLGRATLGSDGFANAYRQGWELTIQEATARTDPAAVGKNAASFLK
jgi:ATP/maltotriose-dependent transcriptional regulator MalT